MNSEVAVARIVGPVPITCAITLSSKPAMVGKRNCWLVSSFTCNNQSFANKIWFWLAIGPVKRTQISTHGAYLALMVNAGSAQFWLPQ